MKAYVVWDSQCEDSCKTVVFSPTASQAKAIAMSSESFQDSDYINIRTRRYREMDGCDRGRREIDWNDAIDRQRLVSLGWSCAERSSECDECPGKARCIQWAESDEL